MEFESISCKKSRCKVGWRVVLNGYIILYVGENNNVNNNKICNIINNK